MGVGTPRARPCSWGRGQGARWVGPTAFPGQDPGAALASAGLSQPWTAHQCPFMPSQTFTQLTLLLCFPNPPRLAMSLPNHRNDARPASWQTRLQPARASPQVRLPGNQRPWRSSLGFGFPEEGSACFRAEEGGRSLFTL